MELYRADQLCGGLTSQPIPGIHTPQFSKEHPKVVVVKKQGSLI